MLYRSKCLDSERFKVICKTFVPLAEPVFYGLHRMDVMKINIDGTISYFQLHTQAMNKFILHLDSFHWNKFLFYL